MIKEIIRDYQTSIRSKQVVKLFAANILGIPLGIVTSVVITRYLGPNGYGNYQFVNGIYELAFVIFSFGFFQAGNRALVLNKNKEIAKEYYGAELIISIGLYIVMSMFLVIYSIYDTNIQEKNLSNFMLFTIPFGFSFILLKYFETLLQADNRIDLLFRVRFYPRFGFVIIATVIFFLLFDLDFNKLKVVWGLFLSINIIIYIYILHKLKISFKNFKCRLLEIWGFNKSFGFNVYIGSVFALGMSRLSNILVSYYGHDNSGVGFLALATTLTLPLTFIPNTIATTHYKDFSKNNCIPKKIIIITLGLTLSALIGLWVFVVPFVKYFYGKEFVSVISITLIISFGYTAYGYADFLNRFLGANGQGKTLRNSSLLVGCSALLSSILLIPKWGEYGAAYKSRSI